MHLKKKIIMEEKKDSHPEAWADLSFHDFQDLEKVESWKRCALEIIEALNKGNVGLVADTGTGKTIMALLVFEALGLKTLFVAPTVILVEQHAQLYKKLSNKGAEVIVGPKKRRNWFASQLTIATPHVFQVESQKRLIDVSHFDLIIIDEMHKGRGKYPYTELAQSINELAGKKIMALSASPGPTPEAVEIIKSTYQINKWITANIEMPDKRHRLYRCEINDNLKLLENILKDMLQETIEKINTFSPKLPRKEFGKEILVKTPLIASDKILLNQSELNSLDQKIKNLSGPNKYAAISLQAKYYKLIHSYRLVMTEGYHSFLSYSSVIASGKTKADASLRKETAWQTLVALSQKILKQKEDHPKEEALMDIIGEARGKNQQLLVFLNNKTTASYLAAKTNELGYKAATLFGGRGKSEKRNQQVIEDFNENKVQIIFATSVVEEGLSLPDINVVVHYSQAPTEISRLQRSGRTGRFAQGNVYFVIMNIAYETGLYYAILNKVKNMEVIFYPRKKDSRGKKRGGDPNQLSFDFPDFPDNDLPF